MREIELRNVVNVSFPVCTSNRGDFIEQIFGRLVFSKFKKIAKFPIPSPLL